MSVRQTALVVSAGAQDAAAWSERLYMRTRIFCRQCWDFQDDPLGLRAAVEEATVVVVLRTYALAWAALDDLPSEALLLALALKKPVVAEDFPPEGEGADEALMDRVAAAAALAPPPGPGRSAADKILWKVSEEPGAVVLRKGGLSFTMVWVDGGTFTMGATQEQESHGAWPDERPPHQVRVDPFHMCDAQVTQALWLDVMGSNPSSSPKGGSCPVESATFEQCLLFIEKLSRQTGICFRMPTEAEWEWAARGGDDPEGAVYSGSDDLDEVGWWQGNSKGDIHPVCMKLPNRLGLYDMSGNVREWCSDFYGESYYKDSPADNPTGPAEGRMRCSRGGSWDDAAPTCRCSSRTGLLPDKPYDFQGLRLVF